MLERVPTPDLGAALRGAADFVPSDAERLPDRADEDRVPMPLDCVPAPPERVPTPLDLLADELGRKPIGNCQRVSLKASGFLEACKAILFRNWSTSL